MSRSIAIAAILAATITSALAAVPTPAAAQAPHWVVSSLAGPTNFKPGDKKTDYFYEVVFTNDGGAPTDGSPIVLTDTLPSGLTVKSVELPLPPSQANFGAGACKTDTAGEVRTVTCTISESISGALTPALVPPSYHLTAVIHVAVPGTVSGTLTNFVQVQGGGAAASGESQNPASAKPASAGFAESRAVLTDADGQPVSGAASHPFQYTTSFAVNTMPAPAGSAALFVPAQGDIKDIEVKLPPGLVGNPNAVTRCTPQQFATVHQGSKGAGSNFFLSDCPDSSAVGVVVLRQIEGNLGSIGLGGGPIYNLEPPPGMPAQFGFEIAGAPIYIDTALRSGADYGITAELRNTSEAKRISAASVTIWGVPADHSHDPLRGHCAELGGSCPAEIGEPKPFLRLPTSCEKPLSTEMDFDTWSNPGAFLGSVFSAAPPVGCDRLEFSASFEAQPSTTVADSPSGLDADLHVPQNEDPEGLGEADLRKTVVTLPEGLTLNPSSANGLDACSPAQIGLTSPPGIGSPTFTAAAAQCPDAAKIGTVEVDTPLIDHPLPGSVYVASPGDNPFGSLLAIYVAVQDPKSGIVVKLAGKAEADPATGRLVTTFDDTPQTPFEDFKLDLFEGALAALRTPAVCDTYGTAAAMTPWSAPESGPLVASSNSYPIDNAPGGGSCPTSEGGEPNAPAFDAGTRSLLAGAFSPFLLGLRRADGSQEFSSLTVTPPPGLLAKLAGVRFCGEAELAAAKARPGRDEQRSPSCPQAAEIGSVDVGAGAGPSPYYTRGRIYLAGPYRGAPLSLAVVTPAVAGPYDLGTVVVRTALYVDPRSARITARSDPIPRILQGIPLDLRSIAVELGRPGFTLNPTNCEPLGFGGALISALEQAAPLAERFQVGECSRLRFKPNLSLSLKGATQRGEHPALRGELRPRPGDANLGKLVVRLPHSAFLDQGHIKTICTRVQFAANRCPAAAVYGHAVAYTPLLDQPLRGPVYLRSSDHKLPDLVAALHGLIDVEAVARIDSARGGIRATFSEIPDAPLSKVVMSMEGGDKGLIVNSTGLCAHPHRARAKFGGQNGKLSRSRPLVRARCGGKRKGKRAAQR